MSTALGLGRDPAYDVEPLGSIPYRVVERRVVGPDLVTLGLYPADAPTTSAAAVPRSSGAAAAGGTSSGLGPFGPGQFLMAWVPSVGEIPISVSGVRSDGGPELTIKAVGPTSAAMVRTAEGEVLGLRGPYGTTWPTREVEGRSVLVVAGGLGLAPLRLAVREMLDGGVRPRRLEVVHGARSAEQLVFVDEHDEWVHRGASMRTIVDRPDASWLGAVGNVNHLLQRLPERPDIAMVCGPEVMMRAVVRRLLASGMRADDVYVSLERNMHCAIGICGRCQLGPWVLCRDGVVMPWSRVARSMEVPGR